MRLKSPRRRYDCTQSARADFDDTSFISPADVILRPATLQSSIAQQLAGRRI